MLHWCVAVDEQLDKRFHLKMTIAEWHRYSLFSFSQLALITRAQLCTSTTYLALEEMAKFVDENA